jgi:hypothetical protein
MYGLKQIKEMNKNPQEFIDSTPSENKDNTIPIDDPMAVYTDGEVLDYLMDIAGVDTIEALEDLLSRT